MQGSEIKGFAARDAGTIRQEMPSLAAMLSSQTEQLALCRELEDIADSLPGSVNRQKCIFAAQAIGTLMKRSHSYEEDVFFPWLESRQTGNADFMAILERLKYEHFEDECFAEELVEVLMKLGRGESVNMEAAGYMFRGFFEARRRHIAFERDHLLSYIRP